MFGKPHFFPMTLSSSSASSISFSLHFPLPRIIPLLPQLLDTTFYSCCRNTHCPLDYPCTDRKYGDPSSFSRAGCPWTNRLPTSSYPDSKTSLETNWSKTLRFRTWRPEEQRASMVDTVTTVKEKPVANASPGSSDLSVLLFQLPCGCTAKVLRRACITQRQPMR